MAFVFSFGESSLAVGSFPEADKKPSGKGTLAVGFFQISGQKFITSGPLSAILEGFAVRI